MTDMFTFIQECELFQKFEVDELSFVEFKCFVEDGYLNMWSESNYFAFVTSGKKMWRTQRADYLVDTGDAIFVKKGANIAKQFINSEYCVLLIFIPDNFIKNFIQNYYNSLNDKCNLNENYDDSDSVIPFEMDGFMKSYVKSLEVYFSERMEPNTNVLKLKFEELLLSLFSSEKYKGITNYFFSLLSSPNLQLKQIMLDNYSYNLKLEEYATLANMSLSTFKRSFKSVFNESPGRWIANKKIALATHFLKTSDKPVNEIAYDCGFEDPSHFIKVFKKHENVTPLVYRNTVNA